MAGSSERGHNFPCFKGKVIVITGASSGIGEATAVEFAKDGAKLALTGRNAERLNGTAQKCINEGIPAENILQMTGDIVDDSFIKQFISETVSKLGGIDVLVNNAGNAKMPPPVEFDRTVLDMALDMFVRSIYTINKCSLPYLKKSKGNIVNVSSIFASVPGNSCMEYCLAKSAMSHMSVNLAYELARDGIRINSVSPGATLTQIYAVSEGGDFSEKIMAIQGAKSGFKRLGKSEEIAAAIQFLASSAATYITGIDLTVDGGQTIVPFVTPEQLAEIAEQK